MNFLQDADGNLSSMRLMLVLSFGFSILIAVCTIVMAFIGKDAAASVGIPLVGMFLGVATAGKVGQSFAEKKPEGE